MAYQISRESQSVGVDCMWRTGRQLKNACIDLWIAGKLGHNPWVVG